MYILKTADGLYWKERFEWTDTTDKARKFASPKAAANKAAALAENGVTGLIVSPVVGSSPRKDAAADNGDAKPDVKAKRKGRKAATEQQPE